MGAFLSFQHVYAQEQEAIAAKENITMEEMIDQLNKLVGSDKEEDRAQLALEAEVLAKHSDEDMINLAVTIYDRFLEDPEQAEQIRANIDERFPKGKTARTKAYNEIFRSADESFTAAELDAKHDEWIQQFPPSSFDEKSQAIYGSAKIALAVKYAGERNQAKAVEVVQSLKGTDMYVAGVNSIYNNISAEDKDYAGLVDLIKDAYDVSKEAASSEDETVKNSTNARFFAGITPVYAEVLSETENHQEVIAITKESLENAHYTGNTALKSTNLLASSYLQLGQKPEALAAYEQFIIANGTKDEIVENARELYNELNGADADFETHLANLDKQASTARFARYTDKMIKEEAPGFTLVNRGGNEVSLSDYEGKVIVLDFWATWCGPCINSFPGMQAALNKYEADPDVEFLFINTWERVDNYEELVEEFITKHEYSFHVLFDEMKNRSDAVVTAYGVEGIPTKFIIDGEGFIRFKSVGSPSYNVDEIVTDLETMITLAKGE